MARGIFQFNSRITTDTDTALVAAPSAAPPERLNIRWITVDVEASNASGLVRIEDGVGGNVIATIDCSDDNNRLERVYLTNRGSRGYQLTAATLLNAESTSVAGGGVVVINGEVEVT